MESCPNLEALTVADEGFPMTRSNGKWPIPLPRLRRLALSCVQGMENPEGHLVMMLDQTTVLEDLEFHADSYLSNQFCGTMKSTLRRLVYSFRSGELQETSFEARRLLYVHTEEDLLSDLKNAAAQMSEQLSVAVIPDPLTPRMLPNLEILETDQVFLYGPIFQDPEDGYNNETYLVDLLPPKLRILHVGLVLDWEKMRSDLVVLASRAHHIVPELETVHLDVYEPRTAAGVGLLREALAEVKIKLVVGEVPRSDCKPRGMLGPRPGHPEVFTVPPVRYPLTLSTEGKRA